ncbi:MAG: hypothetical protein AAGA56_00700 [Myxococcota bacterium]
MIAYRLYCSPSLPVIVRLDVEEPDDYGKLIFEGQRDAVASIRQAVASAGGVAGHNLGYETTPADLGMAMRGGELARYQPQLLEGQDILDRFVRQAPGPGEAD